MELVKRGFIILLILVSSLSSIQGSFSELSDLDFETLLQDLSNQHFYTAATILSYAARPELVQGTTLLIPTDDSLVQASFMKYGPQYYRDLVQFHTLQGVLSFREFLQLPLGTWLPTALPGYGVQVTHNSATSFALNDVPVIEPNLCPNLAQISIKCYGIDGVLNPLSKLSPKPNNSPVVPSASEPPTPSPSLSPLPSISPSSSITATAPTPTTATGPTSPGVNTTQASPSPIPPIFQSPVNSPIPPFGFPPSLLAPAAELTQNNAMLGTKADMYILALSTLAGFFVMQIM